MSEWKKEINPPPAAWRDVVGDAFHHTICDEHRQWQSCPRFRELIKVSQLDAMAEAVHVVGGRLESRARLAGLEAAGVSS